MKKILILCFCFMTVFEAYAQRPTFVRKQKQPDFFIPAAELETKEVLPPIKFKTITDDDDGGSDEKSVKKNQMAEYMAEGIDVKKYSYYSGHERVSPYKKVYDEYVKDLDYIKRYNKIPKNRQKDDDLGKLKTTGRIAVWVD